MSNGNKTFVRITNKDIYDKLEALTKANNEAHVNITGSLQAYCNTNDLEHQKMRGNIKLSHATAAGALAVAGYTVIWLWEHIT